MFIKTIDEKVKNDVYKDTLPWPTKTKGVNLTKGGTHI
jgi:hypothetical protein